MAGQGGVQAKTLKMVLTGRMAGGWNILRI